MSIQRCEKCGNRYDLDYCCEAFEDDENCCVLCMDVSHEEQAAVHTEE